MLAHDQPTLDVVGHAVALERRVGDELGAALLGPLEAPVVGDVAVVQRLLGEAPDRTLGEHVPGGEQGQLGVRTDQRCEVIALDD